MQDRQPLIEPGNGRQCIILLHGLARTRSAMARANARFRQLGYQTRNIGYPSTRYSIEKLAVDAIGAALQSCPAGAVDSIHFFTHSMGGILLRYYLKQHHHDRISRAVMLSPPNQGSEIVDRLGHLGLFKLLNGPAGLQLGTGTDDLPGKLGPIAIETGIITGNKSINPLLSRLLPGPDDGKVSVHRARLANMRDFLVLPYTHTFIMRRQAVIDQAVYFFQNGHFYHPQITKPSPIQ